MYSRFYYYTFNGLDILPENKEEKDLLRSLSSLHNASPFCQRIFEIFYKKHLSTILRKFQRMKYPLSMPSARLQS